MKRNFHISVDVKLASLDDFENFLEDAFLSEKNILRGIEEALRTEEENDEEKSEYKLNVKVEVEVVPKTES